MPELLGLGIDGSITGCDGSLVLLLLGPSGVDVQSVLGTLPGWGRAGLKSALSGTIWK